MTRLRLKSALFTDGQIELDSADLPATIGRSPRADIVIHDLQLSRIHAEFRRNSKGEIELVDCDSTNLTIVNQQEIHACVLKSGDQILLGETELLVGICFCDRDVLSRFTTYLQYRRIYALLTQNSGE